MKKDFIENPICDIAGYLFLAVCGCAIGEGYKRHSLGAITAGASASVIVALIMGQIQGIRSARAEQKWLLDTIFCQSKVIEKMRGQEVE